MRLYESAFRIEGVTLFNSFYRAVMIYSVIIENKSGGCTIEYGSS
jgi:hypothetical protein